MDELYRLFSPGYIEKNNIGRWHAVEITQISTVCHRPMLFFNRAKMIQLETVDEIMMRYVNILLKRNNFNHNK